MTLPADDADMTPDALLIYARQCLRQSAAFMWTPTPPPTPTGYIPATPTPPDPRPTGICLLLQGLLAVQLANSISHVIDEHP